ncbi:M15 family metallopeptidase [Protaetiibacter sp. SSC-01]|uniref:M15 family metallopeptidase n=1 Tax=Protaetiibacter sp. SSC-01 TaxID=2759943 RepID=UPI001656A825|nr:M15 family metallopeptidase [Protaetiibacter sp. SSC-01]QNO38447.1 M15 family metallopeptidase [Protaetiibacter sp. SSC-01]
MTYPNDPSIPADEPTQLIPAGYEPTRVLPTAAPAAAPPAATPAAPSAAPPTEVLAPAPAPQPEQELRRPRDNRGGSPKLRLTKRGRVLLIVGIAVAVVVALVAGLLVANAIGAQSAADELASAQGAATDADAELASATAAADESVAALTALVAVADAGLAIAGEGLDEAARPALQEARDAAQTVATEVAEASGLTDVPDAALDPRIGDRENAAAFRARADALEANVASETARAERADAAATSLGEAMTAYLESAAAVGAAVLADRGDADDTTKAALQSQLDAVPTTEPSGFADALVAYRAAVDAVIASSEAARAPTPGGSGVRVPDPASVTVVVNKRRGLPADYVPPDLVMPAGVPNNNGQPVRQVLVADLLRMQADMAAEGITLRIGSAYRSYADQQSIYNRFVRNEGVAGADTHSARPGNSEHQTGLALDLDDGTGCNLSVCFKDKPGGIWLAANAWKYGFILRYGDGWNPIVGYTFEPWHYRYVGVDVATDMHEKGIKTLEEYYGLPAAPDYG